MSFEQVAAAIKKSGEQGDVKMADDELLQLYGLFKQATLGDNCSDKPGMLDLKGKKKWQAWLDQKGKTKEQAGAEYASYGTTILKKYGKEGLL